MINKKRTILVCGVPRSGTTWIANVLSNSPKAYYLHEPDNEQDNILAYIFKKGMHRYPYLNVNDHAASYYKLWKIAFEGRIIFKTINKILKTSLIPYNNRIYVYKDPKKINTCLTNKENIILSFLRRYQNYFIKYSTKKIRPSPQTLVIKSVHCVLSLPWIEKNFAPDTVIIVFKNPFNIITNYLKIKLGDAIRNIFNQNRLVKDYFKFLTSSHFDIIKHGTLIQKMAMQIGGFYYFLEKEILKHPNWVKVLHEDLCSDPINEFHKLFNKLNLEWGKNVENFIRKHDKKGTGFSINRKSSEEIDKWKRTLSEEQIKEIIDCIKIFGIVSSCV